ncbi:ABC transporter [Rhizobiaceae bacterium n13]|uniref:ABC transporter n=1 Tax=Ferirhizobium litorale TaxID=2927786 RepID=A0AAE3QGL7_9HYPH|nr:ABC transporter [Fererhizobium litorale]MDI7864425.1 ABC transporter [Fererhizobium litorale]MDI7924661.1 ABC transporter [Fererhizobium litorale]
MSRILMVIVALFAVANLSACGSIGKGKGKAPPPVAAEPAPVYK